MERVCFWARHQHFAADRGRVLSLTAIHLAEKDSNLSISSMVSPQIVCPERWFGRSLSNAKLKFIDHSEKSVEIIWSVF